MSQKAEPLAIVGIGCLFPKAAGLQEYWANIKAKVDGIGPVPPTHWNPDDYFDANAKRPDMTYARRGGFLDPYPFPPAEFGIAPNDLEATDTSQLLALVVAKMALDDAGFQSAFCNPQSAIRTSVILGVTGTLELVVPLGARLGHPLWRKALRDCGVEEDVAEQVVERISRGYVGWQENSFPGLLGNVVAGRVANRLDLNGTNCVVDAACASSLSAVHLAALELQAGRCDVAITGGVDTFNDIFMYMCFSKTPALSPTGDARPFSADADGTILGEGLGIVVLKRLADAERDGNRIYAVIKGMGTSSDGKGNAVYAPSAAGQVTCLRDAYRNADVTPDTIELIEAHGTGTKVGDAIESKALTEVFREASPKHSWCALGSVKSQLGHTKAAAGSAGLIKAALALYHKVLPPTIKVSQPLVEPGATPFYINADCRPWLPDDAHPRRAGVSAFGFGGSNFHCVLEEYQRAKPSIDWDGDIAIFAFSGARSASKGRNEEDPLLALRAQALRAQGNQWNELRARAAESRRTFDPSAPHRIVIVVQRNQPPDVAAIEHWLDDPSQPAPDGVYAGSGPAPGRLAFLFPGQGAQYVGMLRDLACTFPDMQDVLAEANRVFPADGQRLSDTIYPPSAFTSEERSAQENALRATTFAQPALGAVCLGALRILAHFGVAPDAAAGHSYGELTALCAAGCFEARALFELSQLRGRLMATQSNGDAGAMLAVQAPLEAVEALLAAERFDLVIANKNGPAQAVLSGRTAEIERAAKAFQAQRVSHIRLPVAAAFHSPLVAQAAEPFRQALEPLALQSLRLPVFANTTAREYPRDPPAMRDLLAHQLAKPVEFVEQIRNMVRAGVRAFVEVGSGRTLCRLVDAILADEPHETVALDSSAGKRPGMLDLAHALARLAAFGYPVRLAEWDPNPPPAPRNRPALTVPICGANYRKPQEELPPVSPKREVTPVKSDENTSALGDALRVTQESLAAFQRLQEQTAQLHKQFLETQEAAQRTLQTLAEGQQRIVAASLGLPAPALLTVSPADEALRIDRERPPATGRLTSGSAAGESPQPNVVSPAIEPQRDGRPPAVSFHETAGEATKPTNQGHIERVLIDIVAEKTGYPADMLGLDMGLDADLGIDSIKRVEILSALQEKLPEAPVVKPEHLGTLHTLREICAFLCNGQAAAPPASASTSSDLSTQRAQDVLIAIIAEKTGYPTDMLGPDMGLDADLGIDSIKRVEILSALQEQLPEAPVVKPEHLGTLNTIRQIAEFLSNGDSVPAKRQELEPTTKLDRRVLRASPLTGVRERRPIAPGSLVWLVADSGPLVQELVERFTAQRLRVESFPWDAEPPQPSKLGGLVLIAGPHDVARRALRWLQSTGRALRESNGWLAGVTRLDGTFGLTESGPLGDPETGALAGLIKTAAHEWPEVACKAIDLAADIDSHALADELLLTGPVEVGRTPAGSITIQTVSEPVFVNGESTQFAAGDVVLITGGARGVTAEVAVELARQGATLVLLGRSPVPESEPAELAGCGDETALKQALAKRGQSTPRQIESAVKAILASREIRRTLARIHEAGGEAAYRSVDIRDADAVLTFIGEIRQSFGRIRGFVHGAGVLADRRIDDLTAEQFDAVYSTKVAGLHNVLNAIGDDPLRAIVLFSSSTGRFGRTGQAAYAAANEALNKLAQREARRRPDCRVLALNWGPWAGGMVTPALAKLFASEGIGLIPLADGARQLTTEIAAASSDVEIVILGPNTQIEPPPAAGAPLRMVFERELDLDRAPVLRAHVIDGRAVLPLALTLEWLAHAALHGSPGLVFHGCDDLRVFHPVTVREGATVSVQLFAGPAVDVGGVQRVAVELRSRRDDGREIVHSRAEMLVTYQLPTAPPASGELSLPRFGLDPDDVYQRVLFHGPELRGIDQFVGCGPAGIVVRAQTAPAPALWLDQPLRGQWLTDPLVVDCAFQAMSVWCHDQRGAVSLPSAVGSYRQYSRFTNAPVTIVCRVNRSQGQIVFADVEFRGPAGEVVAAIERFECVLDPSLNQAFRRNALEPARV